MKKTAYRSSGGSKVEAQKLIHNLLGRTVEVIEAKKPFGCRVCQHHYIAGSECDPFNCSIANGAKDHPDVLVAIVLQCVTYILFKSDPDHLHRYDNRGQIRRVIKPEKLISRHDASKLQIPPGGIDVILYPYPASSRLVRNKTRTQNAKTRKVKAESAQRNKDKTKRRRYCKSISSVRKNMLSSFIVGAMSGANKRPINL